MIIRFEIFDLSKYFQKLNFITGREETDTGQERSSFQTEGENHQPQVATTVQDTPLYRLLYSEGAAYPGP